MSNQRPRGAKAVVFICGDTDCPNDPTFEHRFYFGCVPRDFKERTGRSKTHRQTKVDGRYWWNGGCDARDFEYGGGRGE